MSQFQAALSLSKEVALYTHAHNNHARMDIFLVLNQQRHAYMGVRLYCLQTVVANTPFHAHSYKHICTCTYSEV